ncbi:MAG: leucine-rich repeat protein [Lachnospiraceae bacterium]|nr:leucine-rich repeat protein [Lachnospiraceae bacterium]
MFCSNCFKKIDEKAEICEHCGAKVDKTTYKVPDSIVVRVCKFYKNNTKKAVGITLVVLLVLFVLFGIVVPSVKPYSLKNSKYNYEYCGTHIKIKRYLGAEETVNIPAFIGWLPVTEIKENCFKENETIREVVIPDTVKKIGEYAFVRCVNLQKIKLPSGLKEIQWSAFEYTALAELEIPVGVEIIGPNAFYGTRIKSIIIPESVKVIEGGAFGYCDFLEEVMISDKVKEISKSSFRRTPWFDNQKEEFVIVGDNVLIEYAGQDSIICVPEGVKYIGYETFDNKEDETEFYDTIVLPTSLERIDAFAFDFHFADFGCIIFQSDLAKEDLKEIIRTSEWEKTLLVAPENSTVYQALMSEGVECMTLEEYEETYGLP